MRPKALLLIPTIVALTSATAVAQYSAVIASRPNTSVTIGAYHSSLLSRAGVLVGPANHWGRLKNRGLHTRSGADLFVSWRPFGYSYAPSYGAGAPLIDVYGYPIGYTWPYYLDTGIEPLGPFIAPPLYIPPEQLGFGPQAVRRFMGLEPVQQPLLNRNVVVVHRVEAANGNDGNAGQPLVRRSNPEARERARGFIAVGDARFEALNFAEAYDRFKKAAEAAPDLAEPYFRLGHVQAAMARYEQAAAAFRRGLALDPNWPAGGFRLEQIYGGNRAAREAMLDAVARSANARRNDANTQFVAGVQFFFDGQRDKARAYFERAKALGEPAANVGPFLKLLIQPDVPAELDI